MADNQFTLKVRINGTTYPVNMVDTLNNLVYVDDGYGSELEFNLLDASWLKVYQNGISMENASHD